MMTKSIVNKLSVKNIPFEVKPVQYLGEEGKNFKARKGDLELEWIDYGDGVARDLAIRDVRHQHNSWEDTCGYVWFPETLRDAMNSLEGV
jgi:hypothetical protein